MSKNELRYDECGMLVSPFVARKKGEDNESAKARKRVWDNASPSMTTKEESIKEFLGGKIVDHTEIPVFVGIGGRRELPNWAVEHHTIHIMSDEESGFREVMKPNPQSTLDGLVTRCKRLRTMSLNLIKSFGIKPNHLLEKSWLLHKICGKKLCKTETELLTAREEVWW